MSTHELENKVRELRQLQSVLDEAQAEAETIKDAIKSHMGAQEEIRAGEYKVTWKAVKSSRIDAVALRTSLSDVAARFTAESTSRRFCVV